MKPLRILLAEDDETYREELSEILSVKPGIDVIAAVSDGAAALDVLATRFIDVAVLDIDMPVIDGIETVRRLKSISPSTKVIMLTAFEQESSLEDAVRAGVSGFLTKDLSSQRIYELILEANNGATVMGPRPTEILLSSYKSNLHLGSDDGSFLEAVENLPPRLRGTFSLLIEAMPNKDIAHRLSLSESTVRTYVSQILDITGCGSRSELAVRALNAQVSSSRSFFGFFST